MCLIPLKIHEKPNRRPKTETFIEPIHPSECQKFTASEKIHMVIFFILIHMVILFILIHIDIFFS